MKRTVGDMAQGDNEYDVVILNRGCNYIYQVHESIVHAIHSHLNWNDLSAFKSSCRVANQIIHPSDVTRRLVQDEGSNGAFVICVYENRVEHAMFLLEHYAIDDMYLVNGLVYCIASNKNELALAIMHHTTKIAKFNEFDEIEYEIDHSIYCNQYKYGLQYMQSFPRDLTYKQLLQIACSTNNVWFVDHLISQHQLPLAFMDLWVSMKYCNYAVLDYIFDSYPQLRIKPQMVIALLRVLYWTCSGSRADIVEYLVHKNKLTLNNRVVDALVHYMKRCTSHDEVVKIVKVIDTYGTYRQVQSAIYQSIRNHSPLSVIAFIEHSRRVRYSERHIALLENDELFWRTHHPKVEFMFINKLRMQEREHSDKSKSIKPSN